MRRAVMMVALTGSIALGVAGPAGATAGKGQLFLDGNVVRTVVNAAELPHGGTDPFFVVTNPASGQLGIAGVGPGQAGYTGGDWAVSTVTFNEGVTPYLLTSDEAVAMAVSAGDVSVVRDPSADFRCPIQP
jgi:hypothetical protein